MTFVKMVFPPNRRLYEASFFSNFKKLTVESIVASSPEADAYGAAYNLKLVKLETRATPLLGRVFRIGGFPNQFSDLEEHLTDADAVISVETYSFLSDQITEFAKNAGIKSFITIQETYANHPYYIIPPFSSNASRVIKRADGFIAQTQRAAEHLSRIGVNQERIRMIYPGVDLGKFKPDAAKTGGEDSVRLLYVGLLAKHKGFHLILRAFQELRKKSKVELSVAGDGPLRGLLNTDLGAGVTYHGPLPPSELPPIYASSSIFVSMPQDFRRLGVKTWEEQLGFTLIEAMASGLPVVSTDCGSVKEVLGGQNSVVKMGSVSEVVGAISRLVESPSERARIGVENRRRVEKVFDAKEQSHVLEEYILSVLEGSHS